MSRSIDPFLPRVSLNAIAIASLASRVTVAHLV